MAEQPESLSISCLFPSLGGNVGTQAAPAREANTLTPIPDLAPNLLAENEDVCALFAAAWSLVLYRFILVEEVSFTIHRSSATSLVTVVIQPEEPVRQLVDIYSSQKITSSQLKDSDRINSGLAFSSSSSSCIQAFHSSNCQIGLVIDLSDLRVCLWSQPEFISDQQAGFVASAVSQAIHGIVASPDQAIGAVSIFSNQHLAQVAEWNGHHPISDPPATSVYELIQPLCQSQPDAPAISAWDGEVSYGQMDALTSQLAAHLTEMGVKPNTVVALCFGKSLWAMISMLAVIRTGGAFVFVAPSHPASHRKHILSQACPVMILTTPPHERMFDDEGIPVVSVTETLVSQLSSPSPSGCFKPANDIQDPAYLIFTSGSSGTPKGCAIDHGSLAGMIPLERAWPFDKTCNRIFQFAPFVFGTSMLEFFSAWLTGGVLCLLSDDEWKNDLVGAISRSKATGLVLPVSLAKLISPDMIPTVRMLAVGGEPLDDTLLDRWVDRVRLVQGYGMSENAGILAINDGLTRESDPRNVGQSPNGRIWLVSPDDHHQLAPIGAVAEILFESPGIARKYINNPEKSSATFVEPPPWLQRFKTLSGRGRFLKSGDLARYNADGTINHLGRKDSQVKIRGQRVDVKEVELSLRLHFGTTVDFFVELVRPKHGTPVLAAFMWSKESDKSIEKSTGDHDLVVIPCSLRSRLETVDSSLRSSLPDYMVPPVYLLMAKLPTTITGKVDRRKLREQASALTRAELESLMHGQTNEQMLPPTTPMEQLNYRELEHLENDHLPQTGIDKHDVCDTYPCSSMQQGMLLGQTVDPSRYKTRITWRTSHTNSNKVVDAERLRGAWSAVVQRHPALRTVFSPHPGDNTKRHIQLVLSPAKADNVAKVVHSTSGDQPDPTQTRQYSLPQLTLQKQTSGDVDCLLEIDHPVIDGFSTQILMRDLVLAYDGKLSMDCVPPVMKHENGPKEHAKAYWATLLRDRKPCQFPIMNKKHGDHPARAATYHSMDIELSPSSLLYDASRKHGVMVSSIFQVAWALVLQAFTGQSAVCFGYMVSGRDSTMETAWDAVGFFANMVTRAIDLNLQKTPLDVLQETQRDFVDDLPYQHITPLDISHHLFNTMVSFSNTMADNSTSTSGGSLKFEVTDVLNYPEFDLTLEGSELDGKIGARLKYWDSILSYEQAQSVAGVFQQAIGLLLTSPQQPLSQLSLLSGKDEQQIMEWRRHMPVRTQTECMRFLQLYGTF